jgi:hypothetical protein
MDTELSGSSGPDSVMEYWKDSLERGMRIKASEALAEVKVEAEDEDLRYIVKLVVPQPSPSTAVAMEILNMAQRAGVLPVM